MKRWIAKVAVVVASLGACQSSTTSEPAGSADAATTAGEIDFETAQIRASELGLFLKLVETDLLAARDSSELEGPDATRQALKTTFGALQEGTQVQDWLHVGEGFRYVPGICDSLRTVETIDGRPTMVDASSLLLFYEYLVVDVATGSLYQSYGGVNTGCDTARLEFYGPLFPPDALRIVGSFDREEMEILRTRIRDSFESP